MSSQNVQVTGGFNGTNGTIPGGAQNIQLSIGGARGGAGGFDAGGPGGSRGNGRTGVFSILQAILIVVIHYFLVLLVQLVRAELEQL